jgi:hypothetical protein
MKTKDFIKMLQEVDPDGEGHVRLPYGYAPYMAEVKDGYWDGAYTYLEEIDPDKPNYKKRFVTSTEGYKVEIYCKDRDDIIWDEKGNMDKIRERFRVEYTYLDDYHEKKYWTSIEKEAEIARSFYEHLKTKK